VELLFTKKLRTLILARAQVFDLDPRLRTPTSSVHGELDTERAVLDEMIRSILDGTVYHVHFAQADAIELAVCSMVRFDESVRTTYVTVSQCLANSHRS
jgi:hypothetical protein